MAAMNILFITNSYPSEEHPEFGVFTKEQIDDVVATGGINKNIYFIDGRTQHLLAYFKGIFKIKKLAKDADLIHVFHGLSFLITFIFVRKKPIVVSFLNSIENEFEFGKGIAFILQKLTYRFIAKPRVYKVFKDKIPGRANTQAIYLPNGVDMKKFTPIDTQSAKQQLGLDGSKKYILFVSSKNIERPQKRYDRFKEVLFRIKEKMPDVEPLTLVNEPREKVILYLNAADMHLLTSDFEGSPNSVKETISCNTPVVATDVGNVRDMLNGIPGCFVSKTDTVEELTDLSLKVLKNKNEVDLRAKLIEKGLDSQTKTIQLKEFYRKIWNVNYQH